jgi:hypothetical protein
MENITTIFDSEGGQHVIIDRGNGEFTSMPKAHYDELQKQADQPIGGNK